MSSIESLATTAIVTSATLASTIASTITGATTDATGAATSFAGSSSSSTSTTPTTTKSSSPAAATSSAADVQKYSGIGLVAFLTALASGLIIFAVQMGFFLMLRNRLARIFKPKTYLVPERERTEPPPQGIVGMFRTLLKFDDREIIKKCGLDAYFFLRYLKTLLIIFVPIAAIVIPILLPLNYSDGKGQGLLTNDTDTDVTNDSVRGLDTLAWGNVSPKNTDRYWAHLVLAICVVVWVCTVFFFELKVYIKVRQDYLTSAEHRLRASATTVLVNNVPSKWLTEDALNGLFDVFPGGIRNIWLTRDLTHLLDKIKQRKEMHELLEEAETELIKKAKKRQLKHQEADEKKRRRDLKLQHETKEERDARMKEKDAEARRMAEASSAPSVPPSPTMRDAESSTVADCGDGDESEARLSMDPEKETGPPSARRKGFNFINDPVSKVGHGLKSGVGKANRGLSKGIGTATDNVFGTGIGGFSAVPIAEDSSTASPVPARVADLRRPKVSIDSERPSTAGTNPFAGGSHSRSASAASTHPTIHERNATPYGNTVRKLSNLDDMYDNERVRFWQFWKPPAGGYASPVPQTAQEDPFDKKPKSEKSLWAKIKVYLPFIGGYDIDPLEYPAFHNPSRKPDGNKEQSDDGDASGSAKGVDAGADDEQDEHRSVDSRSKKEEEEEEEEEVPAVWEKHLKKSERPTHRLPIWGFFPGLPLISRKVDTIFWCRKELARLNMEIEEDQKHPERYPLMTSAFIQFNHQVAAHMASQSLIHHLPKQMAPRQIEISPKDVIWDNMALTWWQEWLRSALVFAVLFFMIVFWAVPVAWTAAFSQINNLTKQIPWLGFLNENPALHKAAEAVAGVLPAIMLALLLILVPIILDFLAEFKGVKTGSQKTEFVQVFYFIFLFIQVFLVVSVTSFFASSFDGLFQNIQSVRTVQDIFEILARNLPQAANYFFSYMVLQALSTSSGTLLQIGALLMWYVIARILDTTARNKWTRNVTLNEVKWGSFFPTYTNFACIALVYSIVAPLISLFAIGTFSLLWVAQRYAMLYITRFESDTGGVLYPRAINQTFTGLYVMELCLIGLFSIARNEAGDAACANQAIIMTVVLILTVIYQLLLNYSFSPLFRYLPITFEDEAVLRDDIFQRAQDKRLGLADIADEDEDEEEDEDAPHAQLGGGSGSGYRGAHTGHEQAQIEMQILRKARRRSRHQSDTAGTSFNPVRIAGQVGSWAKRETKSTARKLASPLVGGSGDSHQESVAAQYRAQQRQRDIEAQRTMGDAMFGGVHDEIEDLTPDERDVLVRHAFQHYALRARRPAVWIPKDDIGIGEDEIARSRKYSDYIWITNEGAALDSKTRVVYGRAPPDFSEVDLINL
jgi:hypothetical protein